MLKFAVREHAGFEFREVGCEFYRIEAEITKYELYFFLKINIIRICFL